MAGGLRKGREGEGKDRACVGAVRTQYSRQAQRTHPAQRRCRSPTMPPIASRLIPRVGMGLLSLFAKFDAVWMRVAAARAFPTCARIASRLVRAPILQHPGPYHTFFRTTVRNLSEHRCQDQCVAHTAEFGASPYVFEEQYVLHPMAYS